MITGSNAFCTSSCLSEASGEAPALVLIVLSSCHTCALTLSDRGVTTLHIS